MNTQASSLLQRMIEQLVTRYGDGVDQAVLDALWLTVQGVRVPLAEGHPTEKFGSTAKAVSEDAPLRQTEPVPEEDQEKETVERTSHHEVSDSRNISLPAEEIYAVDDRPAEDGSFRARLLEYFREFAFTDRLPRLHLFYRRLGRLDEVGLSTELDEESSVEASAECGYRIFKFKPRRMPRFCIDFVLETDVRINLWRAPVVHLVKGLRASRRFRYVRCWQLAADGSFRSYGVPDTESQGELRPTSGRQLTFFVTHGLSVHWGNGHYASALRKLSKRGRVIILRVRDQHLPLRGFLGTDERGIGLPSQSGRLDSQRREGLPAEYADRLRSYVSAQFEPLSLLSLSKSLTRRGEWCTATTVIDQISQRQAVQELTEDQIHWLLDYLRSIDSSAFHLIVFMAACCTTPFDAEFALHMFSVIRRPNWFATGADVSSGVRSGDSEDLRLSQGFSEFLLSPLLCISNNVAQDLELPGFNVRPEVRGVIEGFAGPALFASMRREAERYFTELQDRVAVVSGTHGRGGLGIPDFAGHHRLRRRLVSIKRSDRTSATTAVDLEAELRQDIADGKVIVVAGAGLSASVTGGAAPGWRKLVQTGIEHLRSLGENDEWCNSVQSNLNQKFPDALLSAADAVDNKLRQCHEFAPWLRRQFEGLSITDDRPLRALADWNCRVVTTNYDDLLSRGLNRTAVHWQDSRNVVRFNRNDEQIVLHIHGCWNAPDSVVLGISSYGKVGIEKVIQSVLRSLALSHSLVLIGCSDDGLTDPNLGVFLAWLHDLEQAAGAEHRHYRLYCGQEPQPATLGRIFPVRYGEKFEDLADFLQKLVPHRQPVPPAPTGLPPVSWPEAVHRYVRSLAEKTSRLSLLGFGRRLQVDLPIERAWVPLRVLWTETAGELRRHRALQEQGERRPVDVNALFQNANGETWRGALLLGEPGAGKTTAANQLAWRLASGTVQPRELNLPAGICPVLLRFRDLSDAAAGADGGLKQFLSESLFRPLAPEGLQQPGTELWDSTNIPILWILDGLDEIVDHSVRQRIARWITRALNDRENDRFLVTCRFAGYNRAGISLGPGFREFHVQALNETDQQRFISDWFTLVYERLGKASLAADKAGRLLKKLSLSEYQTPKMRELTGNPMLLTVLCLVFHDNEDLPKQRSEVYAHCVRVLLEHWRKELYAAGAGSVPRQPLDANTVEEVLQQLAWWLHSENQRTSASPELLADQTEQVLGGLQPSLRQNLTSLQFLDRVREETGILVGEANGEISFLNLAFQEYLASKFAIANGQGEQLAVSAAASDWWRETALLSLRSTRPFCGSFFRSLLQQPGLEQRPDLLEQCLNEAKFVDAEPFVEIVQQARQQPQRAATVLTMLQNRGGQLPALADAAAELLEAGLQGVQPATVAQQLRQAACELLLRADRKLPGNLQSQPSSYDERIQMSFVQIPAGSLHMGGTGGADGAADKHPLRITQPFLLGRTPVTNAQYELFLSANPKFPRPAGSYDQRFNQPQQPVVGVSWHEAIAYCSWANGRLPTEAEWEYACKAGNMTDDWWGHEKNELSKFAWFHENSGDAPRPVGWKSANAWGLHDMLGNVWEWTVDEGKDDKAPQSLIADRPNTPTGVPRIVRGGSWHDTADDCSASYRNPVPAEQRTVNIGFRLARTLPIEH